TAFQIQDDILGIFGNSKELGKPVGGDIRENKQTILRIHSMKHGSEPQIQRLNELMGNDTISAEELEDVRKIFSETGAVTYAQKMIEKSTQDSISVLESAQPPLKDKPKKLLIALANYLQERKK
ncbi:MAG: polyprenyl synthetase family protein, partial [Candidatus Heimdallarchaeota archaeon]